MAEERDTLRDWHRLFGLLLTDFFTDTPFDVEIESDLSLQQQFLDVVIVRRRTGTSVPPMPDGMEILGDHNLITFKSHRETLDAWAMKELIGHSVAYRKLVSESPTRLIPEDRVRLFAVSARFPQKLSTQVPWRTIREGVYDCNWGTDQVRVVVTGQLATEEQNAVLHLFSPSPLLVEFGRGNYRRHSSSTSQLLGLLLNNWQNEGIAMPFTMQDFEREYIKDKLPQLPEEEQVDVLANVSVKTRLTGVSKEQLRRYLEEMDSKPTKAMNKPKRKKK